MDKVLEYRDIAAHRKDAQGFREALSYRDFVAMAWAKSHRKGRLPAFEPTIGEVFAYINQGRWLAECPTGDGCAFEVNKEEPYLICIVGENHGPYLVVFPSNIDSIEIELLKRPEIRTINWTKGETLTALRAENKKHGVK